MSTKKKLLLGSAGAAAAGGGGFLDVDDVFSTFLYDGTSATQNIANGINLGDNIAGSVDFDGAGDSLESTSHSFAYGTGDFTVEFWMYPHSLSSQSVVFGARADASTGFMIGPNNSGEIRFYYNNAERIVDTGNALSTNTWFHIAVTRASGTTKLFKNGTQVGSSYSDTNNYTSSVLEIGQRAISDGLAYDGLVSNVRVVLGTAVYTSNFTAPTEPLTAISGTELLICTANNFLDEGPNNIAFTVKGDPQVSSSSPFTGNTGEGGLVWIKRRNGVENNDLYDTVRGATKDLRTNAASAQGTEPNGLQAFNSNGFTVGGDGLVGVNGGEYVSWTFRKAPKFFDVVTYTGNGVAGRTVSHNLGTTVGSMFIKLTSGADNWSVYHRGLDNTAPEDYRLVLNATNGRIDNTDGSRWNRTAPTSTEFTLGADGSVNASGQTYVAYLFAHNNGDGNFGPDADQDIIKCGSYTGNGSTTGPSVNLGFEPQWVLIKLASGSGENWILMDNMRGMPVGSNDTLFEINDSGAEKSTSEILNLTATGFDIRTNSNGINTNNQTYIYMAIRRGPLAEPESATDVFHIQSQSDGATYSVGFPIDTFLHSKVAGSSINAIVGNRLTGNDKYLITNSSAAEGTSSGVWEFDLQNSFKQGATTSQESIAWHWKRAPSFFDVVAYTGNSTNNTEIKHNLGVVPEMVWTKQRTTDVRDWSVYHSVLGNNNTLTLNTTALAEDNSAGMHATPTATSLFLKASNMVNANGQGYIAYLFATLAGVSKVGSYTGDGTTSKNIDCGFSNGARFVMIKRTDSGGGWIVFDTVRGLTTAAADPFLYLDSTAAESQNVAFDLDPYSSGFNIGGDAGYINASGGSYIFYAIA